MTATDTDTLAGRSLGRLQDAAGAIADDVKGRARDRLSDAADTVGDVVGQTRERARGLVGDVDGYLRDRTFLTIGIAAGAALLLGFALRGGARRRPSADDQPDGKLH